MMYDAIIIGTGFSGLAMAIRLKEAGIQNFIILEKADDVGGTWRENTYPGAECDIPSALYSFSFEPYPYWEYKWSHQPQILAYLRHCAKKYGLYPHIHFQETFTGASWRAADACWKFSTAAGKEYHSRTLITAVGQLHYPSVPDFPGIDSFAGPSFHSAEWDHQVVLAGKSIAVIGNAASAVQFIPEIAPTVGKLLIFQRSANWMLPKQDRLYSQWEKGLVRRLPILLKLYRLKIWLLSGLLFFMMKTRNSLLRRVYEGKVRRYIRRSVEDPETREKLIPDYPLGARRLLFSDNYYPTLNQKQVELITNSIQSVASQGIRTTDGRYHRADVLIFATGFKTHPFLEKLKITGKDGRSLHAVWANGHRNYLGMTVSGFPNFFIMYGPNTNLGHSSIILMSEAQAGYIAACVTALLRNKWASLDVKESAMENYYAEVQHRLRQMIWTRTDRSWYQTADGDIPNNWPGRTLEYMLRTRKVQWEDFHITGREQ